MNIPMTIVPFKEYSNPLRKWIPQNINRYPFPKQDIEIYNQLLANPHIHTKKIKYSNI